MTGLNRQVRHSPGSMRRESSQAANETTCESDSGIRDISCFFPLQRRLHAMCQRGAFAEPRSLRILRMTFVDATPEIKGLGINQLAAVGEKTTTMGDARAYS